MKQLYALPFSPTASAISSQAFSTTSLEKCFLVWYTAGYFSIHCINRIIDTLSYFITYIILQIRLNYGKPDDSVSKTPCFLTWLDQTRTQLVETWHDVIWFWKKKEYGKGYIRRWFHADTRYMVLGYLLFGFLYITFSFDI